MKEKEYHKMTEKELMGKQVRIIKEIANGYVVIPVGTIMEITRKYRGFGLEAVHTCNKCHIGRKVSISRVEPRAVELIENGE